MSYIAKLNKRHALLSGILVSAILPGIFVFSGEHNMIAIRFLVSFLFIFSVWLATFSLIDFGPVLKKADGQGGKFAARLMISFSFAIMAYLFIGFLLDKSGFFLSKLTGDQFYSFKAWFFLILRICFFNALFILIKYLVDSREEKRKLEIEMHVLKSEHFHAMHEALKQQVNPHFLFNSLNTLKSLIKQNSKLALVCIDELADVYRYMLLHYEKKEVSIGDEIGFLKSYLQLLQIRFGQSIITQIDIPDGFLNSTIPPATLQLLVENAVKHNILSSKKPLHISITANEDWLTIENNLQHKRNVGMKSGLGLRNINTRYKILKGREIRIESNDKYFRVMLPVN